MPIINRITGEVGHGVGGARVSINNVPFNTGSFGGFLNRDEAVFVNGDDGWVVSVINLRTQARRRMTEGAFGAGGMPANLVFTGGGLVASQLTSSDAARGLYVSTGLRLPDAGLVKVGPNGELAYKPSYQSMGPTLIQELDGSEWTLMQSAPSSIALLGNNRAVWLEGTRNVGWRGTEPVNVLPGDKWNITACYVKGQLWVSYYSAEKGLVVHPAAKLEGFIVSPAGVDAWAEISTVEEHVDAIYVAVSRGEGQQPGDIWGRVYDLNYNVELELFSLKVLNPLWFRELGSVTPMPPPVNPGEDMTVQALQRKMWISPFYSHGEQYGNTPMQSHAGNAIMVIGKQGDPSVFPRNLDAIAAMGQPMIVMDDNQVPDPAKMNTCIALFAHCQNAGDVASRVDRCRGYASVPVIAYVDKMSVNDWPATRPWNGNADDVWPTFPAYREPGESIAVFKDRLERIATRLASYVPGGYIGMAPGFYTRNNTLTPKEVLECMPVYEELLGRFPICVFMPFADRRPQGMLDHPEFRAWALGFLSANVARPNRFDYWKSSTVDTPTVLKNKLQQTIEMVVLSRFEKDFILARLGGGVEPGPVDPPVGEPVYRSFEQYWVRRWNELGIPQKTAALAAELGGVEDEARYKAIQCPAMVQVASELYAQGNLDVGLNIKNGGNLWRLADGRNVATDIFAIKPTVNGVVVPGNFHLVDCVASMGAADSRPVWSDIGPNGNSDRPWAIPPR